MQRSRREFLEAGAAAALAAALPSPTLAAAQARPNIVLIIVDTLRADHVSAYGGRARTPNIDALAARGLRFTRFYPEAMATVPARRSIMTGRRVWPFRNWHEWSGLRGTPGWQPIADPSSTFTSALRRAGYWTGHVTDNPFLGFSTRLRALPAQLQSLLGDRRPGRAHSAGGVDFAWRARALARAGAARGPHRGAGATLPRRGRLLGRRVALVGGAGLQGSRSHARRGEHAPPVRARCRHLRAARALDPAAQLHRPLRARRLPRPGAVHGPLQTHERVAQPGAPRPGARADARPVRRRGDHDRPLARRVHRAARRARARATRR